MSYITLYQLNSIIQKTLDQHLEPNYWVVAEIGEIRLTSKGHCYLELVEKEGQHLTAKIRANIWAYDYRNLSPYFRKTTGKDLETGMKILVKVGVQFHELYGLSLQIRDLDANFTLGERARHRKQVIDRLLEEDLLKRNGLLPLPVVPQRIAVISSQTAAGYGDFMDQLVRNREGYQFQVTLFESVMQGHQAIESMVRIFEKVNKRVSEYDLVLIIRGGGSQVDLDCFDSYELAATVAQCPLPVITGIGHDRDETVVDLVAHTKIKTPTAVAEFLISGMKAFDDQLKSLTHRLKISAVNRLQSQDIRLQRLGNQLDHRVKSLVQKLQHQTALLAQRIRSGIDHSLGRSHLKLGQYQEFLGSYPYKVLNQEKRLLHSLQGKITLADPMRVLKRGFSITYKDGAVVKDGIPVGFGDELVTRTYNQVIKSKVSDVQHE